ncbi:Diphthamide biosynthesis protein 4 [Kappamyces sp. JEL0829]|nr:Diphthamide biosynthesis protein 4 [Kappamyces sp. JEL0829]
MKLEKTLYEILGISSPHLATAADIRQRYQQLARTLHPDKLLQRSVAASLPAPSQPEETQDESFTAIQHAYDVLSDPEAKQSYDHQLVLASRMGPVQDEIDLDDMAYDPHLGSYSLDCRCGGAFVVTEPQLEAGIVAIECSGCSLFSKIIYQAVCDEAE